MTGLMNKWALYTEAVGTLQLFQHASPSRGRGREGVGRTVYKRLSKGAQPKMLLLTELLNFL